MRNVWEGRSYTKEDVEAAINEVAKIPGLTEGAAEGKVTNLLSYSMPPEEAVDSIYHKEDATHLRENDYESFSQWDNELPPPKVDEWITFSPSDGKIDIREKTTDLTSPIRSHYVYCIEIEYNQPSLQSLERESNVIFQEIPSWLRTAWNTDTALYVGYTGNFSKRVIAHAVGTMADGNSPAMVTALADVIGAGIVETTPDKEHALTVEEKYAENLRSVVDEDSVCVYQY